MAKNANQKTHPTSLIYTESETAIGLVNVPKGQEYNHDYGCHEVNNYWRLDKLEEQE